MPNLIEIEETFVDVRTDIWDRVIRSNLLKSWPKN